MENYNLIAETWRDKYWEHFMLWQSQSDQGLFIEQALTEFPHRTTEIRTKFRCPQVPELTSEGVNWGEEEGLEILEESSVF